MKRFTSVRSIGVMLFALLLLTSCAPGGASTATPENNPTATQPMLEATLETAAPTATEVVPVTGGEPTETGSTAASAGLTFTLVPGQSEARYRVREQLANRDLPNDAVGATDQVSGSITLNPDGSIDTSTSQFVVDASTLATDQDMRDNYVRRNILLTDQYPTVTFIPTSVSGLSTPLPTSGPVEFELTGDLTIRDVTKPVTWTVTGQIGEDGQSSGTATTSFNFAEFNLPQPQVPIVLGVEDNITLELDLVIQNAQP